jgi:signal transduction histidine kinase
MNQRQKIRLIGEEKQRQLEIARIKGQVQERSRIASELHDNVNTKIAAVRYRLEALGNLPESQLNDALATTLKMVDDAYQDIRFISKNIIPEDIKDQGLDVAIREFVDKLSINDKVKFELQTTGDQWPMLTDKGYEIYLIIFELFNNALKHSNASLVKINMAAKHQLFELEFTDNGDGFDIDNHPRGNGISNMLSRVQLLNGQADLQSKKGEGVNFSARIPLT